MKTEKRCSQTQNAVIEGRTRLRGHETRVPSRSGLARIMIDLVILVDGTGSMQDYIDGVREALLHFVDVLVEMELDLRIALVVFRDELRGEKPQCVPVGTSPEAVKRIMANTTAHGGGDIPESSLRAIMHALDLQGFRAGARKVLLLVTDAPPHDPEDNVTSETVLSRLKQEDVLFFACAHKCDQYVKCCNWTGGTFWELTPDISSDAFSDLLVDDVAPTTVKTIKRDAAGEACDPVRAARRTLHR